MHAIAIADDDSLVGHLPERNVDLLISLGDLCDPTIERAMALYRPKHMLAVRGNHDTLNAFPVGVISLHYSTITIDGIRFGGFGGSWRYKSKGWHLYGHEEVSRMMENFPKVDVFIAHNSPRGIHERDADVHQGFDAFLDYIDRAKPKYFLHGHQHVASRSQRGTTEIIGVFGESCWSFPRLIG